MTDPRTLVLIPARMAATRLPGKPMLDIGGLPMVIHVLRRAEAAQIGRVAVATDTPEIAAAVTAHGGEAIMTRPDHPSGSDRVFEALGKLDPDGRVETVINLQGDFPTIRPDNIRAVLEPLADPAVDIATLAAKIHTDEEAANPNVVKAVGSPVAGRRLRALYFTRATAPHGKLRAMRALHEAGVPVGVMVAPVVPMVTDHELEHILEAAREHGAQSAGYVLLRLPHELKQVWREWLQLHYPGRAAHVMSLVQQMRGGKDYDSAFGTRMRGEGPFAQLLRQRFRKAHARLGFGRLPDPVTSKFTPPRKPSPQHELF